MKKLEEYASITKKDVSILWNFDEDDEDMQTLGQDLKSRVNVPFKIEEVID